MKSPRATTVTLTSATATPFASFDVQNLTAWVRLPSVLGA